MSYHDRHNSSLVAHRSEFGHFDQNMPELLRCREKWEGIGVKVEGPSRKLVFVWERGGVICL